MARQAKLFNIQTEQLKAQIANSAANIEQMRKIGDALERIAAQMEKRP